MRPPRSRNGSGAVACRAASSHPVPRPSPLPAFSRSRWAPASSRTRWASRSGPGGHISTDHADDVAEDHHDAAGPRGARNRVVVHRSPWRDIEARRRRMAEARRRLGCAAGDGDRLVTSARERWLALTPMRILVTGGAGFVGSSLAAAFKRDDPSATASIYSVKSAD